MKKVLPLFCASLMFPKNKKSEMGICLGKEFQILIYRGGKSAECRMQSAELRSKTAMAVFLINRILNSEK